MRRAVPVVLALTLVAVGAGEAAAAERSYVRKCDRFSSVEPFETTPRDARLGRAKLISFRTLFENTAADDVHQPEPGTFVLKAALVFSGKRDLTISADPSVADVLRLDYGGRDAGYTSVRFRSCARRGRVTGYPGALIYTGPWPACVPVRVAVGDRAPQRYALSFGAGRCK